MSDELTIEDSLANAKKAIEDLKAKDPTLADEATDEAIIEEDTKDNTSAKLNQIKSVLKLYCSDSQTYAKAFDEIRAILNW